MNKVVDLISNRTVLIFLDKIIIILYKIDEPLVFGFLQDHQLRRSVDLRCGSNTRPGT